MRAPVTTSSTAPSSVPATRGTVSSARKRPARPSPTKNQFADAPATDALLTAAHEAIAKRGLRARAVSFTPTGLVAYAEAGR